MKLKVAAVAGMLVAGGVLTVAGQNSPAGPTGPTRPNSAANNSTTTGSSRQQPCWEQVGVSQAVAHQRRQILLNTESQVGAVCTNQSLTPQQRQEQIHQLREDGKQQMEALITPQQEQDIKACQQERGMKNTGGERHNQDPCSQTTSRQTPQRSSPDTRTAQPQSQPSQEDEPQ